jgi:HNH endonuclease
MNLRLRFEIMKRDGFRCMYCGRDHLEAPLQVDHVHPRARGGQDDPRNLITSCFDCNQGKKATLLGSVAYDQDTSPYAGYVDEKFHDLVLLEQRHDALCELVDLVACDYDCGHTLGPLMSEWIEDLYSVGCGDRIAMDHIIRAGTTLAPLDDEGRRDLLRASCISDEGFVFNCGHEERISPWCPEPARMKLVK